MNLNLLLIITAVILLCMVVDGYKTVSYTHLTLPTT